MTHDCQRALCLCSFSTDEEELVRFVVARIDAARPVYGPLDLDTNERDNEAEELMEWIDAPLWRGIRILKRRRKRQVKK